MTNTTSRTDHEIALRMQVAELLGSYEDTSEPEWRERYVDFTERFGEDAGENLSRYCVGVRATAEDMLTLCATDFPRYLAIARTGDPDGVGDLAEHGLDHSRVPGGIAGSCDCEEWRYIGVDLDAVLDAYSSHLRDASAR